MMKFLRKRENQIAPQSPGRDRLVPWKSGPQEKEGLTIPLSATIVNTIGIFFSKFFFPQTQNTLTLQIYFFSPILCYFDDK